VIRDGAARDHAHRYVAAPGWISLGLHRRQSLAWHPLAAFAVIAAGLLFAKPSAGEDRDASQVAECPIEGRSDGVERGVNRTNLGWTSHWQPIVDQIAAHKVTSIRLTLTQPIERAADIAAYAQRHGLRVLVNAGLSVGDYYDPAALPRPGRGIIRPVRRLSDLDIGRYEIVLRQFLTALDQRDVRLRAFQVGNEINWADFNGDFPIGDEGRIYDEQSLSRTAEHAQIIDGFHKYRLALETTRALLRASAAGQDTLVVSAGLYAPSPWTLKSNGSALTQAATKTLFDRFGITQAADALAVHVYPSRGAVFSEILSALRSATQICGVRGAGKPCFITEWGFPNTEAMAKHDDGTRLALFRSFERALSCVDRAQDIRGAYLFTWDESPRYSVWHDGRLLDGGAIFGDPPIE
jgi:hypothetical protein